MTVNYHKHWYPSSICQQHGWSDYVRTIVTLVMLMLLRNITIQQIALFLYLICFLLLLHSYNALGRTLAPSILIILILILLLLLVLLLLVLMVVLYIIVRLLTTTLVDDNTNDGTTTTSTILILLLPCVFLVTTKAPTAVNP